MSGLLIAHFDVLAKIARDDRILRFTFRRRLAHPIAVREARLHLDRRPAGILGRVRGWRRFAFG
jgi:hypothetical protein